MYIPVDQEIGLRLPSVEGGSTKRHVKWICTSRDRYLIAVITGDGLFIWLAQPQLLLCMVQLSENDILERGSFEKAYWRCDSTAIAITTSRCSVLVYTVDVSSENCYNLVDPSDSHFRRSSHELFLKGSRPMVTISPGVIINLAATPTCVISLRDELFVCLRNGFAHHIAWDGKVNAEHSLRLHSIPFAHDQLQSKSEFISDSESLYILDAVYAPLVGGYCIVLSDGRAALLTSSDSRFHPNSLLGVWAINLRDATCTDSNHKFRLLLFGCRNGDVAAYHVDEANGALIQTYRVSLSVKNGPEVNNRLGAVSRIQVLPSGAATAVVWDTARGSLPPTAAIYSPFGAQTWCSLEGTQELESGSDPQVYTTIDWGPEGSQIWMGSNIGLSMLSVMRPAGVANPLMEHSERVLLIGSTSLLLSPSREREGDASAPHAVWTTLQPPHDYLAANWPIRFAILDCDTGRIVVAGSKGFAHCNISSTRWKIFGNESQERDWVVTGGLFVFGGTVGSVGVDMESGKELIRFYPIEFNLDKRFAISHEVDSRVMMIAKKNDALATFDIDGHIILHRLRQTFPGTKDTPPKIAIDRLAEIRVGDLITHPACLVSMQLMQLNIDGDSCFFEGVDTVLVNVSGRLITLNPKNASKEDDDDGRFQLNQPIMVASFVEQVFHDTLKNSAVRPHLSEALWLNCGSKGMRVWLPLFSSKRLFVSQDTSFISKRIMLPFELDIVPVALCASDCLAIGLESVPSSFARARTTLYTLHRNSEVFVHHLLRQLLKRNLGVFALEVAASCRSLPHFTHSLELLLHGVLEEEATSSEPIPDPLLPRCVAFIQEFPEFLQTVAHCARKTELALWNSLFAVTGAPNDLFDVCVRGGHLQTAAIFLIVLQSMENFQTGLEQAALLLREALSLGAWNIARDMVRFARSIDVEDTESPVRTPPPQKNSTSRRAATSIKSINDGNEFVFSRFQAAGRLNKMRPSTSHGERENSSKDGRKDSVGSNGGASKRVNRVHSNDLPLPSSNAMAECLDEILSEHAERLLDEHCIRDLGFFSSELDVDLSKVIQASSGRVIADYPLALTRLHSQFSWPYPVAGKHVVDHLEKKFASMKTSVSTTSLNGMCVLDTPRSQQSVMADNSTTSLLPSSTVDESVVAVIASSEVVDGIASEDGTPSVVEAKLVKASEYKQNGVSTGDSRPPSPMSLLTRTESESPSVGGEWQTVDMLVGCKTWRGPTACQTQLLHMLRLFQDACSLEWVFLICLVCRDVNRLRVSLNSITVQKCGVEVLGRIRLGCLDLIDWATENCFGYVSLLQVFSAHVEVVASQLSCLQLPLREVAKHETNGKPHGVPKVSPKEDPQVTRSAALRESFGRQRRERSRSVDRSAQLVADVPEANESCVIS